MPIKKRDEDAESINSSSNGSVRNVGRRSRQSMTNKVSNQIIEQLRTQPNELGKELHELIRNYRNNNGRLLCDCYIRLPTKRTNLDYYTAVKQPIDFIKIQQRLKTEEYESFKQFDADIQLLFNNAIQFYTVDSVKHKDAQELLELYESEKQKRSIDAESIEEAATRVSQKTIKKNPQAICKADPDEEEAQDEQEEEEDTKNTSGSTASLRKRKSIASTSFIKSKAAPKKRASLDEAQTSSVVKKQSYSTENLNLYLEDYLDAICSYQDETQRYLANVFYILPSAKDYPDYYEIITKPIDLKQIARKILSSTYKSIKQMESDLILMIDNAKRYNEPKSIIYKDSCKLRTLFLALSRELSALVAQNKPMTSTKSREKKHKLAVEIAQVDTDEIEAAPVDSLPQSEEKDDEVDEEEDEEDESEEEEEEEQPRRRVKSAPNLLKTMWSVFDFVNGFRHQGQVLIEPFLKLPSKRIYPDYYEDIKQPISVNCIKKKLNKRLYSTLRELHDDFELIFNNAMQYNIEDSLIYKDAQRLSEALRLKTNQLALIIDNASPRVAGPLTPSKRQQAKREQNRSLTESTTSKKAPPVAVPKFLDLKDKLLYLYAHVNDFKLEDRELAPPFRLLPSKLEYPDYYNVIKRPIDMNKIWNKINQHQHTQSYASVDEMCTDFAQMFENACIYNEPSSTLYKDALNLQQTLFTKRNELYAAEASQFTTSHCFGKDPVNDFQAEIDLLKHSESLPLDFVPNAVQTILEYLLQSCMDHQDLEGRTLSDSFLDLYATYDDCVTAPILTFDMIKTRLNNRVYKRLDMFQHDLFQVFNQVKANSGIHQHSQLLRDAYDLQRFFIQKRDEVCRNGELIQTGALSFKLSSMDAYNVPPIEESEALLASQRYQPLEELLECPAQGPAKSFLPGHFYYIDSNLLNHVLTKHGLNSIKTSRPLIACVLAANSLKNLFIFQIYLTAVDTELIDLNIRRTFTREAFKTDLFVTIESENIGEPKKCLVVGIKEFITHEPNLADGLTSQDVFVCESMYSTSSKYFRKLCGKKWSVFSTVSTAQSGSVLTVKRSEPLLLPRQFLNPNYVKELQERVDTKLLNQVKFKTFYQGSVILETAIEVPEEDAELMKNTIHYEQLFFSSDHQLYKLGDYVYVREETNKPPMIVRIDRLWKTGEGDNYYLKGALFLRPTELSHEPTHLFYKNEVFKELNREVTARLDQVCAGETGSKKCTVMNAKRFVTCRATELDERDIYICETKYSQQLKTFRKFTKGLKKFELSVKCLEDEFYFLRGELQLRKHLSPLLAGLIINYDEEPVVGVSGNDTSQLDTHPMDEDWSDTGEAIAHDENSSHCFNDNSNFDNAASPASNSIKLNRKSSVTPLTTGTKMKKIRVKRLKKSGYNVFSKEFRKSLRDTKSSLSFLDMTKEVGRRWRLLNDSERADYEEKAKREAIINAQQLAAEQAAAAASAPIVQSLPPITATPINIVNQQVYLTASSITSNGQGQVVYLNQPLNQPQVVQQSTYLMSNVVEHAPPDNTPKQVQHKEAYIKYIANMRRHQQANTQPSNATVIMPDWYKSLDVRSSQVKDTKVMPPPSAWIKNCASSADVLQQLLSLRYCMLNDAVNIDKSDSLLIEQQQFHM